MTRICPVHPVITRAHRAKRALERRTEGLHRDEAPLAGDQSPVTAHAGPADYKKYGPCTISASCTDSTGHRALEALAALGLTVAPFHEPFHARGRQRCTTAPMRSTGDPVPAMPSLTTWSDQVRFTAELGRSEFIHGASAACSGRGPRSH